MAALKVLLAVGVAFVILLLAIKIASIVVTTVAALSFLLVFAAALVGAFLYVRHRWRHRRR